MSGDAGKHFFLRRPMAVAMARLAMAVDDPILGRR